MLEPLPNFELTVFKCLRMKDNEQIATYITHFRTYEQDVQWSDTAFSYAFRKGLSNRILDELVKRDIPRNLFELIESGKQIDDRYWEREREKSLYSRLNRPTSDTSTNTGRGGHSRSSHSNTNPKPFSNPQRNTTTTFTLHSTRPKKDLAKVLNKDGKLTTIEKSRRADKGLCTYCGGAHKFELAFSTLSVIEPKN